MKKITCILTLLMSTITTAAFGFEAPAKNHVVDLSHLISDSDLVMLNKQVAVINEKTNKNFAALILPSLDGQTIEKVTQDVYDQWDLDQNDTNEGVLIVIAANDYKLRLQTGKKAELDITDANLQEIVDQDLKPKLYVRNFAGALQSSFEHMEKLSKSKKSLQVTSNYANTNQSSDVGFAILNVSVALLSALLVLLFIRADNKK